MAVETPNSELATVRRILWATDADVGEFLGFFTESTVFQMGNERVVGREAITEWVGGYLASVVGTTHEVLTMWQSDDGVAVRIDVTYRMKSGNSHTLPAMTHMKLDGDKLAHYLIFMDPTPVAADS